MEKIIDITQYIYDEYKKQSGNDIDKMKLHKLLYLVQRETLALTGEPMFSEEFEAWKYGPVCREVRKYYKTHRNNKRDISLKSYYIVKNIILQYGVLEAWRLSDITHKEISWINARKGLEEGENGSKKMSLEDIKKDAEKVRPYDSIWDMYYDEFDDLEEY